MEKQKTLVFIGAHPDDETFGIGGTLAKYAAAGVNVIYLCATRGEVGEINPPGLMADYASVGDLRWAELKCAAEALGLKDVIWLGYRDSGMAGTEDNNNPLALAGAPLEEVTGRIVREIRRLKPQVVITFDPIGGYRHPDHIAVHNAAVKAFHASADANLFPEAGAPFQPRKLYFHVFPNTKLKIAVKVMPFFGKNPRKFGKNGDIDLVAIAGSDFPVNAVVRLRAGDIDNRDQATACHASQLGGRVPGRGILNFLNRLLGQKDTFMRAYPPVSGKQKESDLFSDTD